MKGKLRFWRKRKLSGISDPYLDAMNVMKNEASASADIHSDILGSYTGTAADGGAPSQDADDL